MQTARRAPGLERILAAARVALALLLVILVSLDLPEGKAGLAPWGPPVAYLLYSAVVAYVVRSRAVPIWLPRLTQSVDLGWAVLAALAFDLGHGALFPLLLFVVASAACRLIGEIVHRVRSRAEAAERGRLARELHDGLVQALAGIEMEMEVLRRQAEQPAVAGTLARLQGQLRREMQGVRELTTRTTSLAASRKELVTSLAEAVERFQRETGIAASFRSDIEDVPLPDRTCHEVARIVQEGLVNVRKHSHARHVAVRLAHDQDAWKVVIADDGRGFAFEGRLGAADLEAIHQAPRVIGERARAIGGALAVESHHHRGARLEVVLPRRSDA